MNSTHRAPTRPRSLPETGLGSALLGSEEQALVLEVLRRRELFRYYGPNPNHAPEMVATLEREFAAFIGIEHALAVTSGTAALEVALAAAGIGPGDEVILPAYSWISCFTSIVRAGARPVLAEIDASLMLDPREIGRLATPKTKAVMVIHYQGGAADMKAICRAAKARGLLVIEDCAQAMGVRFRGQRVGTFGDIATFSFQFAKVATAGEGGMVVTRNSRLYERAVRAQDIGNYRPYHAALVPPTEPAFAGGQYRMAELTGAVALAQLRKIDRLQEHCRRLQRRILPRVAGLPGITLRPLPDPDSDFGYESYLFLDDPRRVAPFKEKLTQRRVHCEKRTGVMPQYEFEYVKTGLAHAPAASPFRRFKRWPARGYRAADFPRTEALVRRFIALPIGARYTDADADAIAEAVIATHKELYG